MTVSGGQAAPPLTVDVWSDVVCPFCYLGDTLLDEALTGFPPRDRVTVRYRSFQLMPELEEGTHHHVADLLAAKRGIPREAAEQMNAQVAERAAAHGLDYRFDRSQTSNTRRAHELSHLAARHGLQHRVMQGLFVAYFTEGRPIGDPEALADIGAEAGLDRDEVVRALADREFADEVEADLRAAREMGIGGVPFFVFAGKYAVQGAQPAEVLRRALDTAWADVEAVVIAS